MDLNLITFAAPLTTKESVMADHHELLDAIAEKYNIRFIFPEELTNRQIGGPTLVFVGSGGVEQMIKDNIDKLPPVVILLADGLKNSLAASLEALSWMRMHEYHGYVLHGPTEFMMRYINAYMDTQKAFVKLRGNRVGIIGHPSGWLIASDVAYISPRKHLGVEMVDIHLDEVVKDYEAVPDSAVQDITDKFINEAAGMKEPDRNEVVKAMRLYVALKGIVERHNLSALTLNCFDLIPTTHTTGCVALAMLNEEGIPAGCEGDMQTILTMLAVKACTGEMAFMANPSAITDHDKHEMIFSHCTIAPGMTDRYIVRDHFESRSGVAIEGIIEPTDVTIVKCGGLEMERFFLSRAKLLECTSNPNMCRTQLHLRLNEPLNYFMQRSIGNHHVIVRGDHYNRLLAMFMMLGAIKDKN